MTNPTKHISVCICTFRRPQLLKRLLDDLATQETNGLFTYSIVVADNDQSRSAEAVVRDFAAASSILVTYCVEPQQNISLARNKAIENATGDLIAFVDDDEFPIKEWLLILFKTLYEHKVDGVLGPVKPYFDDEAPKWVIKGRLYRRRTYPTGTVLKAKDGRTGNVLLRKRLFVAGEQPFRPQFRGGEDQDFFRRMTAKGRAFIWCDEAVAYEVVPPARWKRTYMLRKALLRGANALKYPNFGKRDIAKSMIAVPVYMIALPFALMFGQHRFMDLLDRLFNHLGKLLALLGIDPIKEPYVTD